MYEQFQKYVDQHKLFNHDQKIMLTISGGIDSMVMADLFIKASVEVAFAHCNFGLRDKESDADEAFVKQFAAKHQTPIYIKKMDTRAYAAEHQLSIQMAARELRYNWFEKLVQDYDYKLYATAHHFDDQMETFFINLLRGTGISGMSGIPIKNGNCIRPLLFASRNMIADYAEKQGIAYREDSSNSSNNYLRNRIRHWVLPTIEKTKPDYRTGFAHSLNTMKQTEQFIAQQINRIKKEIMHQENDHIFIDKKLLMEMDNKTFVLFRILQPYQFNFSTVQDIVTGLGQLSGKRFFSETHELITDRKHLILTEKQDVEFDPILITQHQQAINMPIGISFSTFKYEGQPIPKSPAIAWLDISKLQFPLELRNFRPGEYFYPLGMEGRKKISDFFIDEKFSILKKRNTFGLFSGGKIAWIIGHRIDDRFRITKNTSTVYAMELIIEAL